MRKLFFLESHSAEHLFSVGHLSSKWTSKCFSFLTEPTFLLLILKKFLLYCHRQRNKIFDSSLIWTGTREMTCSQFGLKNKRKETTFKYFLWKMESASVLEMYKHSKRLYNIDYRRFTGDGNRSSYSLIDGTRTNAPTIVIAKSQCANQGRKRMGWRLRKLLQNYKGDLHNMQKFIFSEKGTQLRIGNVFCNLAILKMHFFLHITLIFDTEHDFISTILETPLDI